MKNKILLVLTSIIIFCSCKKEEKEPSSVYIYSVISTPTNSESVTLKNNSGNLVDLSGWIIGNLLTNVYSIPNGVSLSQDSTKTFKASTMGFRINEADETIYLKTSSGSIIDTWSN
jgi:hypothetical protein